MKLDGETDAAYSFQRRSNASKSSVSNARTNASRETWPVLIRRRYRSKRSR
jgi:hypothetical protein